MGGEKEERKGRNRTIREKKNQESLMFQRHLLHFLCDNKRVISHIHTHTHKIIKVVSPTLL